MSNANEDFINQFSDDNDGGIELNVRTPGISKKHQQTVVGEIVKCSIFASAEGTEREGEEQCLLTCRVVDGPVTAYDSSLGDVVDIEEGQLFSYYIDMSTKQGKYRAQNSMKDLCALAGALTGQGFQFMVNAVRSGNASALRVIGEDDGAAYEGQHIQFTVGEPDKKSGWGKLSLAMVDAPKGKKK